MSDGFAISASGLTAASRQVATAASNIANGTTDGYARRETVQVSQATGGVLGIHRPVMPEHAQGVDLPTEILNARAAERAYASNAAVVRTQADMMDEALDLIG